MKRILILFVCIMSVFCSSVVYAVESDTKTETNATSQSKSAESSKETGNPINFPKVDIKIGDEESNLSSALQIVITITILALAPTLILMLTPFVRILIIFSFIRRALGLQTTPPNQVLIALSLFLTFYIMSPVLSQVYTNAYLPFSRGEINQETAYNEAMKPIRVYLKKQVRKEDLALFVKLESGQKVQDLDNVSDLALAPAFLISELKTSFIIGFQLFLPFLVIDMVVASTLMALGMMMLPPVIISLPFKILLFVLVDGWNVLTKAIIAGISV